MKLIARFLKPHLWLCVVTVLLLIVDTAGALFIPTLAAEMLNQGTSGATFDAVLRTGGLMAAASVLSGVSAILGGYACATLTARIGKDMRVALYDKSLKLSKYDFRHFGIASITTRTVSDITNIQTALTSFIQMVLPVPFIFIVALVLAIRLDWKLGMILLAVIVIVFVLALFIMNSAAPLFQKLQKLLDRMTTILLENLTGVRVVRAFNNEQREEQRMGKAFAAYADTSIRANRHSRALRGISFFCINLFVVIVYWLSGGADQRRAFADRRHHRHHQLRHHGAVLFDDGPVGHYDDAPRAGMLRACAGGAGPYPGDPGPGQRPAPAL